MYTVEKRFGPFPAAHRQAKHPGHCAFVHGHNWYVTVCLRRTDGEADRMGFVFDFGLFKPFRDTLTVLLDHTLLLAADDPLLSNFLAWDATYGIFALRVLPAGVEPSAEHLARYIHGLCANWLNEVETGTWSVVSIRVEEDERNSATYYPV